MNMNKWAGEAMQMWLDSGGRLTLRQCAVCTKPAVAFESEIDDVLALVRERTTKIYEALK